MSQKLVCMVIAGILLFPGCKPAQVQKSDVLARIGTYDISADEFRQEYGVSHYAAQNTPESRREFLSALITRKVLLQEAQRQKLDTDTEFLKSIEKFWEQSLLKVIIEKKTRQLAGTIVIADAEIKDAYDALVRDGKTDKPYDQLYRQLKFDLMKRKETQALEEWIKQLRAATKIHVNNAVLDTM